MRVLENSFRPYFQPKGICNSSDYSGDNSSSLTSSILSSVSQLGSAEILSNAHPPLSTIQYSRPVTTSVLPLQKSNMSTWLVLGVLVVAGVFAVKKL
jgi:hypothetical protein